MTQCQDSLEAVAHVPPSVQTVYCALYGHQPMTGRQLRDATNLPRRTIYAALQRLKELHVVKERASLRDTRQTFYWVSDPNEPPVQAAGSANWTTDVRPAPALSRTRTF
jgi:DNA-binding transcriptional regulator GbsR (MarR family)